MPTTALPGTRAEALSLIRHIAERSGIAVPEAEQEHLARHAVNQFDLLVTEWINEANFLTVPALSPFVPIVTYKVPDRQVAVIEGYCNGVSDWLQFDYVQWQIRVNDGSVPGYDIIGGPIGLFPDVIQRIFVPAFQGQTITVLANNIATIPAVDICAKITGRCFPDTSWAL
jgi:hypothetical protein